MKTSVTWDSVLQQYCLYHNGPIKFMNINTVPFIDIMLMLLNLLPFISTGLRHINIQDFVDPCTQLHAEARSLSHVAVCSKTLRCCENVHVIVKTAD